MKRRAVAIAGTIALIGAVMLGWVALTAPAPPRDPDRAVRDLIGTQPVLTMEDWPGSSIYRTTYTWEGSASAVWTRADQRMTIADGWHRQAQTVEGRRSVTYVRGYPPIPSWLAWLTRRSRTNNAYLRVTVVAGKAVPIDRYAPPKRITLKEKRPWTTIQVEQYLPPAPPRAAPTSPPRTLTALLPTPP